MENPHNQVANEHKQKNGGQTEEKKRKEKAREKGGGEVKEKPKYESKKNKFFQANNQVLA